MVHSSIKGMYLYAEANAVWGDLVFWKLSDNMDKPCFLVYPEKQTRLGPKAEYKKLRKILYFSPRKIA